MTSFDPFFRWTELDRTTFPEWRDRISAFVPDATTSEPRSYPGYPRWPLPRARARWWPALDRVLLRRRLQNQLHTTLPTRRRLGRLLQFSHGVAAEHARGPVPSAGGLQALELYLVTFTDDWLPAGAYHYDRRAHALAQLVSGAERTDWQQSVPSLRLLDGGALLWIVVGDGERVQDKYGERGYRFLLLEAGHLMQNLCLVSTSLGLCTVPLGGFLERPIARALALPAADLVLYTGVCGTPARDQ
jgi:SagB-type dehydrogenase family enzyme